MNEGLTYLKSLASFSKAPILFIEGSSANEMANWFANVAGNAAFISSAQLGNVGGKLLVVKDAGDITDPMMQAALKSRNAGSNVIIATAQHIKSLDYVKDPAFIRIYADDADVTAMMKEVSEVKNEIA
jgi:hypothetical protein